MTTRRNKQKSRNVDGIGGLQRNVLVKVPRGESILPDRILVKLTYPVVANLTIPAASLSAATRYRPSAAYDVDPTLGSTATPGFSEWASFYSNYRVLSSKLKVTAVNTNNGSGVSLVIIPLTADPGAAPSTATIISWMGNPAARMKPVGVAGSVPCVLQHTISTERIIGTTMVYTDDNFASLVTTSPVTNWYWGIGATIPLALGGNLVLNMSYMISMDVEFFSRKSLVA